MPYSPGQGHQGEVDFLADLGPVKRLVQPSPDPDTSHWPAAKPLPPCAGPRLQTSTHFHAWLLRPLRVEESQGLFITILSLNLLCPTTFHGSHCLPDKD